MCKSSRSLYHPGICGKPVNCSVLVKDNKSLSNAIGAFGLALCLCLAELFGFVFLALLYGIIQQSYCRHTGVRRLLVRRPSVKPIFSETVKRIKAKFWGKTTCPLYLQTILSFFKILFIFFFVNMGPYVSKSFKRHLL